MIDSSAYANPDYYIAGSTCGHKKPQLWISIRFPVYIINSVDDIKIILLYSHSCFGSFCLRVFFKKKRNISMSLYRVVCLLCIKCFVCCVSRTNQTATSRYFERETLYAIRWLAVFDFITVRKLSMTNWAWKPFKLGQSISFSLLGFSSLLTL